MSRVARPGLLFTRVLRCASHSSRPHTLFASTLRPEKLVQHLPRSICASRSFISYRNLQQQAAAVQEAVEPLQEFTRFQELADHGIISPKVIDTIVNRMNIHTMTDVQRLTINECLDGADVIAQARTGTGKTLAFLMPIVQRILRDPKLESRRFGAPRADVDDVKALILSPTRELAEQIAVEAKKITAGTAVKVQTAVGGTQKSYHLRKMQQEGCHILVGTPGRVKDILSDPYSGVKLPDIECFVLDEADRLLDIGFAPEIQEIQGFMPPRQEKQRQTLMFSATVPKEVVSLVRQTMRPDFKFVRTVDPDEAPTHARIPQKVVLTNGLQNHLPVILEIALNAIEAHKQDPSRNAPFKGIVFFSSTNEVSLANTVFANLRDPSSTASGRSSLFSSHPLQPCQILEMHGRLTQALRTNNSQRFRTAESALLFSSDVTARGMDFPNVSHIIQVGLPKSSDDYVHRLGRTGRAGKGGEGWLIINNDEKSEYRKRMGHSGIKVDLAELPSATLDMTKSANLPAQTARIMQMIESGIRSVSFGQKAETYRSLLGVLGMTGRGKQEIINLMNDLARYGWGLEKPPALDAGLHQAGVGRVTAMTLEVAAAGMDMIAADQDLTSEIRLEPNEQSEQDRQEGLQTGWVAVVDMHKVTAVDMEHVIVVDVNGSTATATTAWAGEEKEDPQIHLGHDDPSEHPLVVEMYKIPFAILCDFSRLSGLSFQILELSETVSLMEDYPSPCYVYVHVEVHPGVRGHGARRSVYA